MWKTLIRWVFGQDHHPRQTNDKQERFTVRSRNVLAISHQIAEERHDSLIRTEHILLAIVREGGGIAGMALKQWGITAEKLEPILYDNSIPQPDQPTIIKLAPETKKLLELAVDEARRQGIRAIGSEQLLLGMTHQKNLPPMKALVQLGITVRMVRETVRTLMLKSADAESEP